MKVSEYLGMNLRNQKYIDWNKDRTKFTNSKLKTKFFLSARQIRVPRLHGIIRNHKDLTRFDFNNLPSKTVLKPNKGSQGKGIIPFDQKRDGNLISVSHKEYTVESIQKHTLDILDGRYSMGFLPDTAFFEEKIDTHPALTALAPIGLPDIRIIMYKGYPVLSMMRLPNKKSGGKANLNAGAWGLGIDLVSGKVKTCYQNGKLIKSDLVNKFKIPYYKEALEMAVKIAQITQISFFGCDIAISKNGPVLIELNSKPGLKIQFVNNIGLKKRLEMIDDLNLKKSKDPIFIASQLFNTDKRETENDKQIIKFNSRASILTKHKKLTAKIEISTNDVSTFVSSDIYNELKDERSAKIKVKIGKISEVIKLKENPDLGEQKIQLGTRFLENYKVDFEKNKEKVNLPKATHATPDQIYIKPSINFGEVDFKMNQIAKSIKLVEKLKPLNLNEEIKKFEKDRTYNPQFIYGTHEELIYQKQNDLLNILCDDSQVGKIFEDKKAELFNILNIIQNIGNPELKFFYSKYIKAPSFQEFKYAKKLLPLKQKDHSPHVDEEFVHTRIKETLKQYNLKSWKVQTKQNMIGNFSVNKSNKIFVKSGCKLTKLRLEKIIAHEILTHVITTQNGKKQPYLIFQDGLANYLETQEGMAIYNEYELLGMESRYYAASNLISSYIGLEYGFAEAVQKLRELGFPKKSAMRHILKTKRGLCDTSKPGGITKQSIYTRGALKIEKFIKDGGSMVDLYIGKIDVDKLDQIKQMNFINHNIILPEHYRKSIS